MEVSGGGADRPAPHNVEHTDDVVIRVMARRILGPFGFTRRQKREVWEAFVAHPAGVGRCAERAKATGERTGTTGAGLLLTMIRAGEHRLDPHPARARVTGWRFVRGTHSGTYVPDPAGTDLLPDGYH
jgi:hypothetical protein